MICADRKARAFGGVEGRLCTRGARDDRAARDQPSYVAGIGFDGWPDASSFSVASTIVTNVCARGVSVPTDHARRRRHLTPAGPVDSHLLREEKGAEIRHACYIMCLHCMPHLQACRSSVCPGGFSQW